MKDVEPEEMARRVWLSEKIRKVLSTYSFQLLEPSPIENLETLEAKSGPAVREEIYWFKDKAGRNLGLRFDLTVGMTRMIANRFDLPEPIKIASIGGIWRYDEPQFGRYRYPSQWDAEIFGVVESSADAEIISLGSDILKKVGLDKHEIRISNRKLAEGFLRSIDIQSQPDIERVLRVIDGLGKTGQDQAERELARADFSKDKIKRILGFADMAGEPDKVLSELEKKLPRSDTIKQGFTELSSTIEMVEALGKLSKCKVDLRIVRGIGYYDGTVFEAYDQAGEDIGSIFGGGRFDKLCKIYGKRDMPATGVAGGIERLILSLERKGLFPSLDQAPQVFVITVNDKVTREALKMVQELRANDIRTDYDLKNRPFKKQLEYADTIKAALGLIIGPRELSEGSVRIKNMKTGNEKNVARNNLIQEVRNTLLFPS
jgi:histidyl-tRNA synthetase